MLATDEWVMERGTLSLRRVSRWLSKFSVMMFNVISDFVSSFILFLAKIKCETVLLISFIKSGMPPEMFAAN